MALKHLELSEMVGLTAGWVGAQRPLLQAIPQVAAWMPRLDEAHLRAVEARPISTVELDAQIADLSAQQAVLDHRHDDLIRYTSYCLEAEPYRCRASDPPDLERAALCERARRALLPGGLNVVNTLYIAESGNAARTRALLASGVWLRDLLVSIPIPGGGTLLSVVEAWCSLGEQLGLLEEKKVTVRTHIACIPRPRRAEMLAARNGWLAIVNMILTSLSMVEGHEDAIETLRGPVLRTAEIAGKRYRRRGDSAPVEAVAPAPSGVPAGPGLPGAKPSG